MRRSGFVLLGFIHSVVFSFQFFKLTPRFRMFRFLSLGVLVGSAFIAGAAEDFKPDAGFTPLFNSKDLTGWKVAATNAKDKSGDSTDGKTETPTKFLVKEGNLVIDAKVKGDITLYTTKTYGGDVHIKFEFKPGEKCNNDLYFRGQKFDIKADPALKFKEGEWNTFEIIIVGGDGEFKCNGESVKKFKAKPDATTFGIRAELGAIEYRKLQIKSKE